MLVSSSTLPVTGPPSEPVRGTVKPVPVNGTRRISIVAITMYTPRTPPYFRTAEMTCFFSVMDGATMKAGAVGGVTIVRNPITAARAVLEKSEHVMLTGEGANQFAILQGLDTVDNSYFYTQHRFEALQKAKNNPTGSTKLLSKENDYKFGTVGAAALDKHGNLAAATSTGGMTNKKYGRIGDSPIIGAGTYANNNTCAVSCTGHGEFFIRYAVAHDISAMMEYKGVSLQDASNEVVNVKLKKVEGSGGVIAIDKNGNIAMPFNTEGMYRGFIHPDGKAQVFIYKD